MDGMVSSRHSLRTVQSKEDFWVSTYALVRAWLLLLEGRLQNTRKIVREVSLQFCGRQVGHLFPLLWALDQAVPLTACPLVWLS